MRLRTKMTSVKSLYTCALEAIPSLPSPSQIAEQYFPKCHPLYYDLYNLFYEEERQQFKGEHKAKFR